jgi:flagellar basal body L-ring protein FlgH
MLLGDLRRDLDDEQYLNQNEPVVGGQWREGGLLDRGRGLASQGERRRSQIQSEWNSQVAGKRMQGELEPLETSLNSRDFSSLAPPVQRRYVQGDRASRADFQDNSIGEGSLWASDGQTNYYFTKNKIRGVGDLVSVKIEKDFLRDAGLEIQRTLSPGEREKELEAAQERLNRIAMGLPADAETAGKDQLASSSAAAERSPASGTDGKTATKTEPRKATWSDVEVLKSMDLKEGDVIMAEVLERYPNGNYKIRGSKRVKYRNSSRVIMMTAIAKGSELDDTDTLSSSKLYEYRLEGARQ